MAQLEIPDEARCLGCGYALFALTASRCPECGRAFDPKDLATVWLPGRFRRTRLLIVGAWALIVWVARSPWFQWPLLAVVATALVAVMPARRLRFWENLWPYAPLTFGLGWFLWSRIVMAAHEALGRSSREAICRTRGIVFGLFAIPLSWSLSWHVCSHVRVLYIFPVGLPVFVSGDHCGNAKDARTVWDRLAGREGTRSY